MCSTILHVMKMSQTAATHQPGILLIGISIKVTSRKGVRVLGWSSPTPE